MSEETLQLNPEEIKRLSRILADTLIQQSPQMELTVVTCVSGYETIREDQITQVINLDLIASSTHGITDILGQIAGWFSSILDSVASWIVSSIRIAISGIVSTISSIINTVTTSVSVFISSAVTTISSYISGAITSITSTVSGFISSAVSTLLVTISGITSIVSTIISGVISTLSSIISGVSATLSGIITSMASSILGAISGAISAITGAIYGILTALTGAITSMATAIMGAITGAISAITTSISSILTAITNAISGMASTIIGAISGAITAITTAISGILSAISDTISKLASTIVGAITNIISALSNIISNVASSIMGAISTMATTLAGAISGIVSAITGAISGAITAITGAIASMGNAIANAISGLIGAISNTISGIAKTITDAFSAIGKTITDILSGFIKTISDMLGSIAKKIIDNIVVIGKGIEDLWSFLVGAFKDIATKVGVGFDVIGKALMGFVNGVTQAGQWISEAIHRLIEMIQGIPAGISTYLISPLKEAFLENLVKPLIRYLVEPELVVKSPPSPTHFSPPLLTAGVVYIYQRPNWSLPFVTPTDLFKPIIDFFVGAYKSYIEPALKEGIDMLWGGIQTLWDTILSGIKEITKRIMEGITAIASYIGKILTDSFKTMYETLDKIYETAIKPFEEFTRSIYEKATKNTTNLMTAFTAEPFEKIFEEFKVGTPEFLKMDTVKSQLLGAHAFTIGMGFLPLFGQLPIRATQWTMRAFAKWVGDQDWKMNISLKPFGIGVETEFNWAKAISSSIWHTSEELMKWLDEVGRGIIYGYSIWITRPMTRLANWYFRNILPVEIPDTETVLEFTRRMIPHEKYEEILSLSRYYIALYGYSDIIIDQLFQSPEKLSITVTDRFGTKRTIPLSLIYELPSASDVATMMVRDIFPSIEEFQKLYSARGMHPDIGALYYFLRFRYPPPERLWQFTMRGISGLLWTTLPDTEKAEVMKEIEPIKAIMPVAPVDLNFKPDKLMTAFKTYMKWHDYFRGAWIKDFPSDNLIYIDTLADIPTKIDQRWAVKWGIYELMSTKQVTYQSPVREFAIKILENTPASEIKMDLTNFSRTILATGLHPDWVPATAVAEAMNVLTEERTALRTGLMGLFKEGFYDIKALDTMLSGFIKSSFQVSYFDMTQMKWTTGWVNLPVLYLPPERKLLELRALTDRSLDILKEIQKDISTAYQEFIIADYNEYKTKLTKVIDNINTFYASDYKDITGTELADQLKIQFVEDYYKPYIEALAIWRDVYTVRRIRTWTQRWLGWVMYRVAYGQVSPEDISKLVSIIKEKAKLTDPESSFIDQVANIMYGIARKTTVAEYLPTPTTLATLSEYMTLDTNMVKQVLVERGLDKTWQDIWLTYITVRPIKADAKSLLSTYVKALRYGVITKETLTQYINTLPQYGFTPKEIDIITKSIDLEEQVIETRTAKTEYIPTPLTLATICEYLPEAREFYDDVVKAKQIPKEWHELWAKYIDLKPLIDDMKRYLSRAEDLYVKFMITTDTFKDFLAEVSKTLGYTAKEMEFLMKITELERAKNAWTELIGTVERMVTLSEYSPKASKYALGKLYAMIDALPITSQEKKELKEIWEEYIRVRPVKSEVERYVTDLINAYVEGTISELTLTQELDSLKKWGLSDDEITFYKAIAGLRRAKKLKIVIG